jgi:hypothetical protein
MKKFGYVIYFLYFCPKIKKNMNEIWVNIKGYESTHQISNLGRLKIKGRTYVNKLGLTLSQTGRRDKDGFFRVGVTLCKDGASCTKLVNRLVAEAFIPNPDNLPEVNHKNRDVLDNSVDNLEWVSSEFNIQHALLSRESLIALYNLSNKKGLPPSDMLLKLVSNYTD